MIDQAYLENLQRRITELETEMSQPGVAADPNRMKALMRDYSHQKKIAGHVETLVGLQDSIAESKTILADAEADTELREMAESELAEAEEKFPAAEKEMQIALLPPDPADSKNVIVEIRAGTGGDEAALLSAICFACMAVTPKTTA